MFSVNQLFRIAFWLFLSLAYCTPPDILRAEQTFQLIRDPHFERGFWCLEPKHPLEGGRIFREGKLQLAKEDRDPVWELVQWYSKESIAKLEPTPSPFGGRNWQSDLKKVVLNPRGTEAGELTLSIHSINEFQGKQRSGEAPWPHLLIQQSFADPQDPSRQKLPNMSQIKAAHFGIDLRLEVAEHRSPASQFVMYLTVANVNSESLGHGDMMWFGVLFYDDRNPLPTPYMIDGDRDHAKFIYNTGISPFFSEGLKLGEWKSIKVDLATYLQDAFQQAWKRSYLTQSKTLSDYQITGMNLGWETPGLSHVSMQMKNLSVEVVSP